MKNRMQWLLPALLALLALTGCSLARPEAGSGGDRFVGFYLVREESGRDFYQNPHLEEYGGETVRLDGYGAINIPREVLFAQKEGEEWVFPGLEGWRLFVYRGFEEDGGTYLSMVTDLAPGEEPPQFKITDEGGVDIISGALCLGPPLGQADWDPDEDRSVWTTYRVYQAALSGRQRQQLHRRPGQLPGEPDLHPSGERRRREEGDSGGVHIHKGGPPAGGAGGAAV